LANPVKETPSAAFGLAIAAGILIILGGVVATALGAVFTFFAFGVGAVLGLIGILWGVLIIVLAFKLRSSPHQHTELGVGIILLSIFSFFGAFGGFVIGFLLGLIGGILALAWNPSGPSVNVAVSSGSFAASAQMNPAARRFCPSCGSPTEPGAKFCRSCGGPL